MRRRLFVFFILILFFGVAATGYLSYSFTKELIVNDTIENLKSETKLAEGYFDNISENIDFDALAHRIKERTSKRATIVRDDGIVIGESEMKSSAMENHLNRPEIRDALLKGWGISTRLSDTQKTNVCYYAERYTVNGRTYVLRLSVQFDSILRMQLKHLRAILFSILGGIIICTILVYIYINTFTKPIRMLTSIATTIALGQYEKRISVSSDDEIGQLGNAFNMMANRLQDTINDLSEKQDKLMSILNSMDDGVVVVDNNQKILLVNPAAQRIFGMREETVGKYFIEAVRNYDIQDIITNFQEECEIKINYPQLKLLKIKTTKVVNRIKNEDSIGTMLFIQDVTKEEAFEKMKSDFVANVSHELRSPLTSIKGFSETLKYVDDRQTRDKFLDIIYIESERLTRLINDILALSELENREYGINFEKINIIAALDEVWYIMELNAKGKNIELSIHTDDENLVIYGDRDKFKQMMINLVDNAIKYTNPNGKVAVRALREGERITIEVEDNGIGIPDENIPRLFERFYRVDKARSRKMGGTGLGLAIVKHIVMIFNGEIHVKSKLGIGTTFTITLPEAK